MKMSRYLFVVLFASAEISNISLYPQKSVTLCNLVVNTLSLVSEFLCLIPNPRSCRVTHKRIG